LFSNDWIAAYINPIYERGKLVEEDWDYIDGSPVGTNEVITASLDTSHLNKDGVVIVFANRPDESPFEAAYLFLISKGDASQ
jgi:hypothetical protein